MKKSYLVILSLVLILALFLSGCSSGEAFRLSKSLSPCDVTDTLLEGQGKIYNVQAQ